MAEFQNDEEKISHYKKVILPLETLVQVVNVSSPDTKMAITVNVKGLIISGFLVPLEEFYEHTTNMILENLRQHSDQETFNEMRNVMAKSKAIFTDSGEIVNKALVNSYVCIKGPKYHATNSEENLQMPDEYWMGKIGSVDGFMIGMPY